jgi:hypothetical protein
MKYGVYTQWSIIQLERRINYVDSKRMDGTGHHHIK